MFYVAEIWYLAWSLSASFVHECQSTLQLSNKGGKHAIILHVIRCYRPADTELIYIC